MSPENPVAHFIAPIIAGGIGLIVLLSIIGLITTVFWIVELVDAARREFDSDLVKIIWLAVIFFFHVVGAIAYYIAGKPMGRLRTGTGSTF